MEQKHNTRCKENQFLSLPGLFICEYFYFKHNSYFIVRINIFLVILIQHICKEKHQTIISLAMLYCFRFSAKHGISLMTFDNEMELHKIKELYPTAR